MIDKASVATLLSQKVHVEPHLHAVTGGFWLTALFVFVTSENSSCLFASGDPQSVMVMLIVVSFELDCSKPDFSVVH